jgi:hypothetical protein
MLSLYIYLLMLTVYTYMKYPLGISNKSFMLSEEFLKFLEPNFGIR